MIVLITGSVHLVGSALLFGIVSGPLAVLASPFLSLFGWFFVLPELVGVTVLWFAHDPRKGPEWFWSMVFVSVLVASTLMGLIGPKEQGHEFRWTCAYVIATAAAATWSMFAIRAAKGFLTKRG
jgi:amino acid transporter